MEAFIWRRSDFRESSRLITLVTRERGRVVTLAKGAHRKNSPLLGRLDFLNRVDVQLAGRGGMPILGRVRLLHEPRALRASARYLCATHMTELFDRAFLDDQPDPTMFELVQGAVRLIEKSPIESLPQVLLGIELRFLRHLGQLADLDRCSACGGVSDSLWVSRSAGGLACERHRNPQSHAASTPALERLRTLEQAPGGRWPILPPSEHTGAALAIVDLWLAFALDNRPRHRRLALRSLAEANHAAAQASH